MIYHFRMLRSQGQPAQIKCRQKAVSYKERLASPTRQPKPLELLSILECSPGVSREMTPFDPGDGDKFVTI